MAWHCRNNNKNTRVNQNVGTNLWEVNIPYDTWATPDIVSSQNPNLSVSRIILQQHRAVCRGDENMLIERNIPYRQLKKKLRVIHKLRTKFDIYSASWYIP